MSFMRRPAILITWSLSAPHRRLRALIADISLVRASLVGGTLLLARAHGAVRVTAAAIYAASVSGLFGVSALYHRGNWTAAWSRRLQRLDHVMIFFLIAGTATPAFLRATRGAVGRASLIVMWTLTLTAAAIHLAWMSAPEVVVGAAFIGLGWAAGLALPGV
jgi:hemolysin III